MKTLLVEDAVVKGTFFMKEELVKMIQDCSKRVCQSGHRFVQKNASQAALGIYLLDCQ